MSHAFFYPSENGDRVYDATSFENWLKKFFTTGVFLNDLQVTANGDMTVNVGTGYANVDAKVKMFEADTTLQIETAGASYPRIDSIVLERNDTERDVFLKVIKGGYSSEPVAHVPVRQDGVYQLVIAQILVNVGAVKISQLDITDTRSDKELCGIVAGAVDQIDFSQIKAQFDAYVEKYKEEIAEYEEQMQADFDAWFENIKGQLSEDAAGHLQNQIDDINEQLENVGGSRVEVTVNDNDGEYNVVGLTVNLEIDGQTYSKKVPTEKKVVFQVLETGTAIISCVDEAQGYNATARIEIPCYSAYETTLESGGFSAWLSEGGYSIAQYPTVADVLADEKAVRKLMTVHASCDAFVDWYNKDNSMLADFTANRVAMKWIGLRDYIADKLMSIPSALEQLLASEHWEYILKDKIPTMTSNTTPEGIANASSVYQSYYPYLAFNGNDNDVWASAANESLSWLMYVFEKPTCVKKISVLPNYAASAGGLECTRYDLVGANKADFSDGVGLARVEITQADTPTIVSIPNANYYKYYSINDIQTNTSHRVIKSVQMYGRSLNESVPVMTSNTAPLGEVFATTENGTTYNAFKAFDNDDNTRWIPTYNVLSTAAGQGIGYKFTKQISAKMVTVKPTASGNGQFMKSFVIRARNSDAEAWENVSEEITLNNATTSKEYSVALTNEKHYKQYELYVTSDSYCDIDTRAIEILSLNFYGVSYSEEEFGSDGIEMLYDNGVEVAPISIYEQANATVTKYDDYVMNISSAKDNGAGGIEAQVNFDSNYKRLITEYDGKIALAGVALKVGDIATTYTNIHTNTRTDSETITSGKALLDVSSVSGENKVCAMLWIGVVENISKELAKLRKLYLIK